jgi:polysaccharide deacetylase family protein (PEP-CTERM system associated)
VISRDADLRQALAGQPVGKPHAGAGAPGQAATGTRLANAMTCDVEDYFQVQAFAGHIARESWDTMASRVERNTGRVLDLFARHGVHATFFTLGWVAERHKDLIRRIVAEGHELASHGMEHRPVYSQTPDEFRADVRRTKAILEDIGGKTVSGYRAASFSITEKTFWAFDVLAEEGYRYSSSIYPVRHDLYGIPDAPRFAFRPGDRKLLEVPMSTVAMFGRNLPCSGGGYFRLLPYAVSRWGFRQVNARDRQPAIFYFHPWEIDPDQPRQHHAPLKSRFRHYLNLHRMEDRLGRLLRDFAWDRMDRIYLEDGARQ